MQSYAFTVNQLASVPVDVMETRLRGVCSSGEAGLVCREVGTEHGHHWHGVVRVAKKPDAFRKWFMRTMELGSDDARLKRYCVKKWDDDPAYLRYCCKGPTGVKGELPVVVFNTGYDTCRLHEQYYAERDRVVEQNEVARKKRRTAPSLRDRFFERCESAGLDSKEDVVRELESFLRECAQSGERLYLANNRAEEWLNAVWFHMHPVRASMEYTRRVGDRWLAG